MLSPESLSGLLNTALHSFTGSREMEISLEVNPATVDACGLAVLRKAGFNRLSIGMQSLDDQELHRLGRPHSAADALQTVQMAKRVGFTNISLDLMYGLPDQHEQTWKTTLEQALACGVQHLSLYELTIEPDTIFARQLGRGTLLLPGEETVLAMMETTRNLVTSAGFERYEISNYCRPGFSCRHNINYWHNGNYIGLGPGGVGCIDGVRKTTVVDLDKYCLLTENREDVWVDVERLDTASRFRETVVMGLRMTCGVSIRELTSRFGIDPRMYYGQTIDRLVASELLKVDEDRLRLTSRGLLLANMVMAELV